MASPLGPGWFIFFQDESAQSSGGGFLSMADRQLILAREEDDILIKFVAEFLERGP